MRNEEITRTDTVEEFEAPTLTLVGDAQVVVQGTPYSGWDLRGLSAPSFEFESDEE